MHLVLIQSDDLRMMSTSLESLEKLEERNTGSAVMHREQRKTWKESKKLYFIRQFHFYEHQSSAIKYARITTNSGSNALSRFFENYDWTYSENKFPNKLLPSDS